VNLADRIIHKIRGTVVEIDLSQAEVFEVLERHGVESWFRYIYRERKNRWDVWMPAVWIAENCSKDSVVFETGCGCGFNLLWLGQRGFSSLYGSDIEQKAVNAAAELASLAGMSMDLWQDDALKPRRLPEQTDILIANWTCFDERFSLGVFLELYAPVMARHGVLVLDVIDSSYDSVPNNRYLTSEWNKPEGERAPSEYKVRYSREQVAAISSSAGFQIDKVLYRKQLIPRRVYLLRKM